MSEPNSIYEQLADAINEANKYINTVDDFRDLCQRISDFYGLFNDYQEKVRNHVESHEFRSVSLFSDVNSCVDNYLKHLGNGPKLTQDQIDQTKRIFKTWMLKYRGPAWKHFQMDARTCSNIKADIQDMMPSPRSRQKFEKTVEMLFQMKKSLVSQSRILKHDISFLVCQKHPNEFKKLTRLLPPEFYNALDAIDGKFENADAFKFWFITFYLMHEYDPRLPLRTDHGTFPENLVSTGYSRFRNSPIQGEVFERFEPKKILDLLDNLMN